MLCIQILILFAFHPSGHAMAVGLSSVGSCCADGEAWASNPTRTRTVPALPESIVRLASSFTCLKQFYRYMLIFSRISPPPPPASQKCCDLQFFLCKCVGLLISRAYKNKFIKNCFTHSTHENLCKFKHYRNTYNSAIRAAIHMLSICIRNLS
jgi:hypothetical protein